MKKIVLLCVLSSFIIILSSSLFLVGCKSDPINGPNIIPPPDTPDTLGNVSGYINSLDGPVEGAYVTLNNETTFSDSNGFFEFKDCIKKDLVITITHSEFSEYSNSISVTDSLNLNIQLTRIKYDYFPLKVGNQWIYYWNTSGYASPGQYWNYVGTLEVDIVSAAGTYPNYTYQLKETRYDSTHNYTTHKYINIQSNNSDTIFVSELSYLFKNYKIRRLGEPTQRDTIYIFGVENSTTELIRSSGILYVFYGVSGHTYSNLTSYKLINLSLK